MIRWCFKCGADLDDENYCSGCRLKSMTATEWVESLFGADASGDVPDGGAVDKKEKQS